MTMLESPFGMRWTTLLLAVTILALVGIGRLRPFIALVTVVAWTGGFEFTYRAFDILRWHEWWGWNAWAWEAAALIGWVLLAHFVGIRPGGWSLAVAVATFAFWVATGFDSNILAPHRPFSWGSEIKNVIAKDSWGLAYGIAAWRSQFPDPLVRFMAPLVSSRT